MQLKAGVGLGEGGNVVEVNAMNVGEGIGVTAGVSSTRSAGSTSGCTHSRMFEMYQYYCLLYIINCLLPVSAHFEQMHIPCTTPASWLAQ